MTTLQSTATGGALDGARPIESLDPVVFYAGQIRSALHRLAPAHMETAELVAQARAALDHASFRTLGKMVGLSASTLNKFVTIHSSRDRFEGREESLPSAWTVLYQVAKLSDAQFETLAASGDLRPELSEKQVKTFAARNEAANDISQFASNELSCLSVRVVFPALTSLAREDSIRQRIFTALENEPDINIRVSERKKFKG